MEKKKISIKKAIEIINDYDVNGCGICHQGFCNEIEQAFEMATEALEKQLIERPILHGHWELRKGFNRLKRCSVCGHEYNDLIECDYYCGNCGAKMDGENDG